MNEKSLRGIDILPHRDPFLFLDRIVSYDAKSSVGLVAFGPERDFFRGHFPGRPIVPGVILLEAMAQSAAAGVILSQSGEEGVRSSDILMFAGAENVRFRRPVVPGDVFETHAEAIRAGHRFARFVVKGYVAGELAAEAEIRCVAKRDA